MVAALMDRLRLAIERRETAVQHGRPGFPPLPGDAIPAVADRRRKPHRQVALIVAQHIDRETSGRAEGVQILRRPVQAEQHQRRVERHRTEGVGGQPDRIARIGNRGDDGHSGGETSKGIAECPPVKIHGAKSLGSG